MGEQQIQDRVSAQEKGSLLFFAKVEIRWDEKRNHLAVSIEGEPVFDHVLRSPESLDGHWSFRMVNVSLLEVDGFRYAAASAE